MIKSSLFRIYNSRTYEKVENLGKNYYGDYCIKNSFNKNTNDNDDVILCSSFKLYDYKGNWIIVFEGDILEITFKEIGKEKDVKFEGKVMYENGIYFLNTIQGKIDLTYSDNIVTFEIIDNFFDIENKLYKIKELFDNYFILNINKFSIYNEEDKIYISNGYIIFTYIIEEEKLKFEILEGQINHNDEIQNMLIRSCIEYLRKEINKIWIDEEID